MKSVTPLPYDTLPSNTTESDQDMNAFDKLRRYSKICLMDDQSCRTGAFYPDYTVASTTSICRAVSMGGDYRCLVDNVCKCTKGKCGTLDDKTDIAVSRLFVDCAREMNTRAHTGVFVDVKPGIESTSDIINNALEISRCLLEHGIKQERFMVSIPASSEGLNAIKQLNGNVRCNATCVFSIEQAIQAANAGASAVSVGVGDVSDYWRWKTGYEAPAWDDRGVELCSEVQMTLRSLNYTNTLTVAMNCRTVSQVLELVGVDCVALAPWMLCDLSNRSSSDVYCRLCPESSRSFKRATTTRARHIDHQSPWPNSAQELLQQAQTRNTDCFHKLSRAIQQDLTPSLIINEQ